MRDTRTDIYTPVVDSDAIQCQKPWSSLFQARTCRPLRTKPFPQIVTCYELDGYLTTLWPISPKKIHLKMSPAVEQATFSNEFSSGCDCTLLNVKALISIKWRHSQYIWPYAEYQISTILMQSVLYRMQIASRLSPINVFIRWYLEHFIKII